MHLVVISCELYSLFEALPCSIQIFLNALDCSQALQNECLFFDVGGSDLLVALHQFLL